ncbi:MAG: preprotein translocase subunit YajC [Bacteroidota bacterium]|jgi:preprotein translocase subunit YajC
MFLNILLQSPSGAGAMQQLVMILMVVVIFYFFMMRPQMKKAKQEREFKDKVTKGDKVVTIGGVHGKVIEVSDSTLTLEIAEGVRVKIEKSAVSAEASRQFAPQEAKK